jgi:hypothetical protein
MRFFSYRFASLFVLQLFISMPLCSHAKVHKVVLRVGRCCCLAAIKKLPLLPHMICGFAVLGLTGFSARNFWFLSTMRDPAMQTMIVGEDILNGVHQLPYGVLFVEAH